jgi:hypothetical protein
VAYSCEPKCCFNHVCGDCHSTFEPLTKATGTRRRGIAPPDPLPDACDPIVACAACESTDVYVAEDESMVCYRCGAVLELELTAIVVGG